MHSRLLSQSQSPPLEVSKAVDPDWVLLILQPNIGRAQVKLLRECFVESYHYPVKCSVLGRIHITAAGAAITLEYCREPTRVETHDVSIHNRIADFDQRRTFADGKNDRTNVILSQ